MRSARTILAIVGVLLAIGCTEADAPQAKYGRLLVQLPTGDSMAALWGGTVSIDADGCVLVTDAGFSKVLVWPSGTTFDEESQAIRLRNGTLARDADVVSVGGGSVDLDAFRVLIEPASLTIEALECVDRATDRVEVWVVGAHQDGSPGIEVSGRG